MHTKDIEINVAKNEMKQKSKKKRKKNARLKFKTGKLFCAKMCNYSHIWRLTNNKSKSKPFSDVADDA